MTQDKKDSEAWLEEIEDVHPLPKNHAKTKITPDIKSNIRQEAKVDHPDFATFDNVDDSAEKPSIKALPKATEPFTRKEYRLEKFCAARASINEKSFKNLAQGKIAFEDVFDMHGLVEDDAYQSLYISLTQAYHQGLKCVIIVHGKGKGYGPNRQMGLLKAKTPEWLERHPVVLAYHTTLPKHGGTGAVYVLLRKKESR